ncbi:MAG: hypothetical protein ACYCX2_01350 [Christensenellales bacterium]
MKSNFNKTAMRAGRKMESNTVRVAPIFKKPLDINKLGNAFLSLAVKLAEEKNSANLEKVVINQNTVAKDHGGESHE